MNAFENLIGNIRIKVGAFFKGGNKSYQQETVQPVNVSGNSNTLMVFNISDVKGLVSNDNKEFLKNAKDLFITERFLKQSNFNEIIKDANLDQIKQPEQLDKGWFLRWLDVAQNTSDEEIQKIISDILRGEFEKKNSFSIRTLATLQNISREELHVFQVFCNMIIHFPVPSWGNAIITDPFKNSPGSNGMIETGLNYSNLTVLEDAGLIHSEIVMGANRTIPTAKLFLTPFRIGRTIFKLKISKEIEDKEEKLKILRLTQAGYELSNMLPPAEDNEVYNTQFLKWINEKWGLELVEK
jgi:hypothetical protein